MKTLTSKKATGTKLKTMRLQEDVVKKVEALAEKENRNFTNMVETLLKRATAV